MVGAGPGALWALPSRPVKRYWDAGAKSKSRSKPRPEPPPVTSLFVIGVTGNIACGKSTVLRALADLGAETIDADLVYHALIAPGLPLWHQLVERYGEKI